MTTANDKILENTQPASGRMVNEAGKTINQADVIGAGIGQSFNREASAAQLTTLTTTAVTSFTWPSGSRPTLASIKPIGGAVWVCFDAPDAATALVWCQGASGAAVDSQRYLVPEYLPEQDAVSGATEKPTSFPFTDGLSNMYILEYATAVTALIVEAS